MRCSGRAAGSTRCSHGQLLQHLSHPSVRRAACSSGVASAPRRRGGMATSFAATVDRSLQQASSMDQALKTIEDYRIISNIDTSQVPEDLKKDCILFYTPDTEPLARKIAAQGRHVQLGNIRWK